MKITDIKTIKLQYPYKKWIADGCGSCGARGAFLILCLLYTSDAADD